MHALFDRCHTPQICDLVLHEVELSDAVTFESCRQGDIVSWAMEEKSNEKSVCTSLLCGLRVKCFEGNRLLRTSCDFLLNLAGSRASEVRCITFFLWTEGAKNSGTVCGKNSIAGQKQGVRTWSKHFAWKIRERDVLALFSVEQKGKLNVKRVGKLVSPPEKCLKSYSQSPWSKTERTKTGKGRRAWNSREEEKEGI